MHDSHTVRKNMPCSPGVSGLWSMASFVIVLAFLASWAVAEWPRTNRRLVSGVVQRFDGHLLTVEPLSMAVNDATIIESIDGPIAPTPHEVTQGQPVTVTLRCPPNSVPSCIVEKVRLRSDIPLR